MDDAEDRGVRAHAERERGDRREREERRAAERSQRVPQVLAQYVQVLPGGADDRVHQQLGPQAHDGSGPNGPVVRQALAEREHHLAPVVIAELARVEAEEEAVHALGEGRSRHRYDRLGTSPESCACSRSEVSLSASAAATRRPNFVMR